jgi:hypothetical protein
VTSWTFYLPFATTVYVYDYTNAGYSEKIVATPESGDVITMTGQGEGNQPTTPPTAKITTPSSGSHLNGFQVKVKSLRAEAGPLGVTEG